MYPLDQISGLHRCVPWKKLIQIPNRFRRILARESCCLQGKACRSRSGKRDSLDRYAGGLHPSASEGTYDDYVVIVMVLKLLDNHNEMIKVKGSEWGESLKPTAGKSGTAENSMSEETIHQLLIYTYLLSSPAYRHVDLYSTTTDHQRDPPKSPSGAYTRCRRESV